MLTKVLLDTDIDVEAHNDCGGTRSRCVQTGSHHAALTRTEALLLGQHNDSIPL
jgi:hypothetical protein